MLYVFVVESYAMIPNSMTVANGKGGVGKTTLAANVAGVLAATGWQILLIDLDRQGNLQRDLGYRESDNNDAGLALKRALLAGEPLTPSLQEVRPRLDVVCGGQHLDGVAESSHPGALSAVLSPLASRYDLIMLDCPTSGPMIGRVLRTVRGVLVPVRADDASVEGLEVIAKEFGSAVAENPRLAMLGVVCFGLPTRATRLRSQLRTELVEALGDLSPVFRAVIRDSARAAWDMRRHGELAIEYARSAGKGRSKRLAALQARKPLGRRRQFASGAEQLAEDYRALAAEVVQRILEISQP